ncbi:MAG: hypothetical protein H0V37_08445 [Chloroflexia bacterium]|nr:hypothetical protein [Chloroflexia bacterium]
MTIVRFPIRPAFVVSGFILLAVVQPGFSYLTAAQESTPPGQHGNHAPVGEATPESGTRSPYADVYDPDAPIRALTAELVEQIRQGQGASLALPAELNGVPGPRHVLDFAEQLNLSPDQQAQVQEVFDRYLVEAIPAGERYLAAAQALEEGFRTGTMTEEDLPGLVADVSRLEGELVTIHLTAHLRTADILTPEQISAYNQLRGYDQG